MLDVTLSHRFDGFALDVAFQAPAGVTAIMGPSGAGKTTVAKMIAGVVTPTAGRVQIGQTLVLDSARSIHVPPHKRRIGYVFQEPRLFPHLSVRQNLTYGAWCAGQRDADTGPIADLLGLRDLLGRMPRALSGGEAQRVALGRALMCQPDLLILDEPLAALDATRKDEILPYLARIRDQARCPIVYISHALAEVAQLATTLVVLDRGHVAALGPTEQVVSDPAAALSLGPRNTGAVLSGTIAAHARDGLTEVTVAAGTLVIPRHPGALGQRIKIRVEASEVLISVTRPAGLSALNILPGIVTGVTNSTQGGVLAQIDARGDRVLCRLTQRSATALALAPGRAVHVIFKSVSVETSPI